MQPVADACSCPPGFYGADCSAPRSEPLVLPGCLHDVDCPLNAMCDSDNSVCKCIPGYSGSACSISPCENNLCPDLCFVIDPVQYVLEMRNRGNCLDLAYPPFVCAVVSLDQQLSTAADSWLVISLSHAPDDNVVNVSAVIDTLPEHGILFQYAESNGVAVLGDQIEEAETVILDSLNRIIFVFDGHWSDLIECEFNFTLSENGVLFSSTELFPYYNGSVRTPDDIEAENIRLSLASASIKVSITAPEGLPIDPVSIIVNVYQSTEKFFALSPYSSDQTSLVFTVLSLPVVGTLFQSDQVTVVNAGDRVLDIDNILYYLPTYVDSELLTGTNCSSISTPENLTNCFTFSVQSSLSYEESFSLQEGSVCFFVNASEVILPSREELPVIALNGIVDTMEDFWVLFPLEFSLNTSLTPLDANQTVVTITRLPLTGTGTLHYIGLDGLPGDPLPPAPVNISFGINATAHVVYIPPINKHGSPLASLRFSVSIANNRGDIIESPSAVVFLSVASLEDPPQVYDVFSDILVGQESIIQLNAFDADTSSDDLIMYIVELPQTGLLYQYSNATSSGSILGDSILSSWTVV